MEILWVGTFGVLGVFSRYLLDRVIPFRGDNFPFATFIANVVGCLVAALIVRHLSVRWGSFKVPLIVGFCGGFTTFSSYIVQIATLWERNPFLSVAYLAGSLIVSLVLVIFVIQL